MKAYFKIWIFIKILLTVTAMIIAPSIISAGEMGIFSIDRRVRLSFTESGLGLTYALDMAEVAAVDEIKQADANGDGEIDEVEKKIFFIGLARRVNERLRLSIGREPLDLKLQSMAGKFSPGEQNMEKLEADFFFLANLPSGWNGGNITIDDAVFAERIGVREMIVDPPPGWKVITSNGIADNGSIMFDGPKGTGPWSVRFEMLPPGSISQGDGPPDKKPVRRELPLKSIIKKPDLSRQVLYALLLAFFLGAAFAMNPGHGRALVSAYLVDQRGTLRHAALLGWLVTAIRITPVVAAGVIIMLLDWYLLPENYIRWLKLFSGFAVVVTGAAVFLGKLRGMHGKDPPVPTGVSTGEVIALGIAGGVIPSATAIALMFMAVGLGQSALGLGLAVSFGVGLQVMLTFLGLLTIKTPSMAESIENTADRLRGMSLLWGLIILCAGVWVMWQILKNW